MAALNNIACNCNARSGVIVSLAACSIYFFYKHIYCAHKLLKRNVYSSQTLPSSVYLVIKYLTMATCKRRAGLLYTRNGMCEVAYTVLNCRLEIGQLRRWCDAAGYGWDYPDSEYRDIPLCFPEALCQRLLLMVLCDKNFRLSPTGLIRVRQSLKTLQPIDELKKGPFTLQVRVLGYQVVDGGVEVDVFLSASSRSGQPVWESVVTLLSTDMLHKDTIPLLKEDSEKEWPDSGNVKTRVQMRVPGTAGLTCVWSFLDDLPDYLLTIPARLFGYRCWSSPSVWMLSVCLAEIEKHKGTGAIRAPISVTAQFKEPISVPGRVEITFWGTTPEEGLSSSQGITFEMEQHKTRIHIIGKVEQSSIS